MSAKSILAGSLCLALAACASTPPPQKAEKVETQPAPAAHEPAVVLMAEQAGEELKAEVGGTILKVDKVPDAVGGNHPSVTQELKYFGLTATGRIKLQILSNDPAASGPVDFEQDPAAAYTLENLKVEFIEAQPSWVRYRISPAAG